ncbi:MAG TPA: hypothetical protein VHE77_08120 [Dongiaceae bacterium]|jgi:hypothetical protein|nr:hypothetical protein [Dongiaceae bacterium]
MTHYLSLANLLANLPEILDRLTTSVRRNGSRSDRSRLHLQSSQSPPRLTGGLMESRERRDLGLWAHRLRIQDAKAEYLSPHLRRDIGLDN